MRPPLPGRRTVALRLAGEVRRRLEPVERRLPVHLPGFGGAPAAPEPAALTPPPDDTAARIDAARERLRATIEPPADETG
jgi:hypothetical protein